METGACSYITPPFQGLGTQPQHRHCLGREKIGPVEAHCGSSRFKADLKFHGSCVIFKVDCEVLEGGNRKGSQVTELLFCPARGKGGTVGAWTFTPCSKISPKDKKLSDILHSDL